MASSELPCYHLVELLLYLFFKPEFIIYMYSRRQSYPWIVLVFKAYAIRRPTNSKVRVITRRQHSRYGCKNVDHLGGVPSGKKPIIRFSHQTICRPDGVQICVEVVRILRKPCT